jgi:hypothetical protein
MESKGFADFRTDWAPWMRCVCGHDKMGHTALGRCFFCNCFLYEREEDMPRPVLSHFIGRKVERTAETKDGHKISLQGDAAIYSSRKLPDGLTGKTLMNVILSSEDTTLVFALSATENGVPIIKDEVKVELNPNKYLIETEEYKPFNPQRAEELQSGAEIAPDDPSPERIFEGPPRGPETGAEPIPEELLGQVASEDDGAGEDE